MTMLLVASVYGCLPRSVRKASFFCLGFCLGVTGCAFFGASFFSVATFAASSARMKTPSGKTILISADSFYRDAQAGLMELKGDVQVVYGDEHLSCDHAVVHLLTQEVVADGHILMLSPTARLEGERAVMNYATETGVVYNGYVEAQQVAVEGKIIHKTGPKTYEAEGANFTACTTCPPAWSFSGEHIKAEMGGYARIRNAFFKIAYFPIPIWFPYIVVPLKSDRQTGFLTPAVGFGGPGGTSLAEPYFWAISRSQDATFTLKNYQFRGPKGLFNYRYALTETTGGELNASAIQDQVFSGDSQFQTLGEPAPLNRYFLSYVNQMDLPGGFVQNTKLNLASDLYYARDFPEEMLGYGDPSFENRASISRNTESTHASLDASYYVNQLDQDPVSSNGDAVHRIPELRYSIADERIGDSNLLFRMDVDYVNFVRNGYSFDHVVAVGPPGANGLQPLSPSEAARIPIGQQIPYYVDNSRSGSGTQTFNPNSDVVRAGQRFEIRPEVSAPFQLGRYVDVVPSLAFRHTQYGFSTTGDQPNFNSSPARDYAQAQLSARTRFSNVYSLGFSRQTTPSAGNTGSGGGPTLAGSAGQGGFSPESKIENKAIVQEPLGAYPNGSTPRTAGSGAVAGGSVYGASGASSVSAAPTPVGGPTQLGALTPAGAAAPIGTTTEQAGSVRPAELAALPPPVTMGNLFSAGGGALAATPATTQIAPPVGRISMHEDRLKHEIEPELSFTTLPYFNQQANPFFGSAAPPPPFLVDQPISDTDFYGPRRVQFDYDDRIINRNVVTLAVSNKLIRKAWSGDEPTYKQIANLRFTQSYDLDQGRTANGYPLSDFGTLLDVRLDNFETNTIVRYYPYQGYVNTSARVKTMDKKGDYLQISFTQLFLITDLSAAPNSAYSPYVDPYTKRTDTIGFAGGLKSRYLDLTAGIDYFPYRYGPSDLDFQVVDFNALLSFKPPGECWGIGFIFQQIVGVGSTSNVVFDYKFGG